MNVMLEKPIFSSNLEEFDDAREVVAALSDEYSTISIAFLIFYRRVFDRLIRFVPSFRMNLGQLVRRAIFSGEGAVAWSVLGIG